MTDATLPLIDTHAHLDDEQFAGDVDAVIGRAVAAGVQRIVNIGYRPERWRTTLALAARYPNVSYSLGLHPHHADEWSPEIEQALRSLLAERNPVAVGEIGLDYYRNLTPPETQRQVFERQLAIAHQMGLPVIIHQRHAERDLMLILDGAPADLVCVLHSFDGTADLAHFAIERGFYLGVGGLMTRSGSTELRQVLSAVPVERLLVETDAPYLVPAGVKNRRNEPANVALVVDRLAELLHMDRHDVASLTYETARTVLRFGADPTPDSLDLCGLH